MFVLGITGGIGCGKSTFANMFRETGALVIDADQISHTVTDVNGTALEKLQEVLPANCFLENGSLDRAKVADLVFQNKNLLDQMSFIIHEEVVNEIIKAVDQAKKEARVLVVLDVPLPVKHGFLDIANYVVVVWAKENIRLERLLKRGLTKNEALQRIACQMTEDEYAKLANLVIDNSADLVSLKNKFTEFVTDELNSRGIFI